jgi:hypothetical protein
VELPGSEPPPDAELVAAVPPLAGEPPGRAEPLLEVGSPEETEPSVELLTSADPATVADGPLGSGVDFVQPAVSTTSSIAPAARVTTDSRAVMAILHLFRSQRLAWQIQQSSYTHPLT